MCTAIALTPRATRNGDVVGRDIAFAEYLWVAMDVKSLEACEHEAFSEQSMANTIDWRELETGNSHSNLNHTVDLSTIRESGRSLCQALFSDPARVP
jgi:hypothetical protein